MRGGKGWAVGWSAITFVALWLGACAREPDPQTKAETIGRSADALSTIATRTYGFESLSDWSVIY